MCWKVEQDEKSLKEQVKYPDMAFPFCVWPDIYNLFDNRMVDAHWHYEFEYSYVVSGVLDYYINDTYLRLKPGDCVFVNSNMLHTIRVPDDCDNAIVFTAFFPTTLLTSDINSTLYTKYLEPIIGIKLEGFRINTDHPHGLEIATLLTELLKIYFPPSLLASTLSSETTKYFQKLVESHLDDFIDVSNSQESQDIVAQLKKNAKEGPAYGFELECMKRVIRILEVTILQIVESKSDLLWRTGSLAPIERAREILAYIHANYHEKITVEEIAKHLNISRSECFRCFKRFTNKRPFEYIIEYRLSKAAQLLRETEISISDISSACGFDSASYFSKLFKEKYAMTPLQYRRLEMNNDVNPY